MAQFGGEQVKRRLTAILTLLLVLLPGTLVARPDYSRGASSITERELRHYVRTLASDRYEGRLSGTRYCERAGRYIEGELKKMHLSPVPGMKGYRREFEIKMPPTVMKTTRFAMTAGPDRMTFELRKDYWPMPFSANGKADSKVVFAGYGITAPGYGYDDYAGVDAKGRVVIVMRHEPQRKEARSPFKGKVDTKYSRFSEKVLNAQNHGAAAVVFVTDPLSHDQSRSEFRGLRIGKVEGVSIPVVIACMNVADWIFNRGPKPLEQLQQGIDSTCKPRSFEFEKLSAKVEVKLKRSKAETDNVMACMRGSDEALADEYIVIGAHYDHIGRGVSAFRKGRSSRPICNGADDNASGTAAVMELAEGFGRLKAKPKRSIIFVLFSGEERGLFGSRAFVEKPPVPLENIVLMVNLDMVGRSKGQLYISGVGSADELAEIINEANREVGIPARLREGISGGSDHLPFYRKRIPILYFATGFHKDYHRPTDDWDRINYADMEKITRLAFRVAARVADLPERMKFTEALHPADRVAYLGVEAKDPAEPGIGVVVTKVVKGSPGAKAGLREGDIVLEFGRRVVKSVVDLKGTLFDRAAGEEIEVVLLRNEDEITLKVKLEKRKDF